MIERIKRFIFNFYDLRHYVGFGQTWSVSSKKYFKIAVATLPFEDNEFQKIKEYCKEHTCKLGIDNVFYDNQINNFKTDLEIGTSTVFILTPDYNKFLFNQLVWGDVENTIKDKLHLLKSISQIM